MHAYTQMGNLNRLDAACQDCVEPSDYYLLREEVQRFVREERAVDRVLRVNEFDDMILLDEEMEAEENRVALTWRKQLHDAGSR